MVATNTIPANTARSSTRRRPPPCGRPGGGGITSRARSHNRSGTNRSTNVTPDQRPTPKQDTVLRQALYRPQSRRDTRVRISTHGSLRSASSVTVDVFLCIATRILIDSSLSVASWSKRDDVNLRFIATAYLTCGSRSARRMARISRGTVLLRTTQIRASGYLAITSFQTSREASWLTALSRSSCRSLYRSLMNSSAEVMFTLHHRNLDRGMNRPVSLFHLFSIYVPYSSTSGNPNQTLRCFLKPCCHGALSYTGTGNGPAYQAHFHS